MADLCSRLLGDASQYQASPIAAATDLTQADAALEVAVYAGDQASCVAALTACAQWLRWAQNIYGGDTWEAMRAACAATQVEAFAQAVPSDQAGLAAFQQGTLFPFHGVIGALYNDTLTVGPPRDSALDFFAVLGAALVTVVGWSYLDWQRARGGYGAPAGRLSRLA